MERSNEEQSQSPPEKPSVGFPRGRAHMPPPEEEPPEEDAERLPAAPATTAATPTATKEDRGSQRRPAPPEEVSSAEQGRGKPAAKTIFLYDDQHTALRRAKFEHNIDMSEVVRRLLDQAGFCDPKYRDL